MFAILLFPPHTFTTTGKSAHILAVFQEFIVAYSKHYFRGAKKSFLCANKRAEIYSVDSNGFHAFSM